MHEQAAWPYPKKKPVKLQFPTQVVAADFETMQPDFPFNKIGNPVFPEIEGDLPNLDLKFVHVKNDDNKGGATFAYLKDNDHAGCNMVEVAVVYCNSNDYFNRRIGRELATRNFMLGMTVLVPARQNNDDWSIPRNLRNMFWYSLAQ